MAYTFTDEIVFGSLQPKGVNVTNTLHGVSGINEQKAGGSPAITSVAKVLYNSADVGNGVRKAGTGLDGSHIITLSGTIAATGQQFEIDVASAFNDKYIAVIDGARNSTVFKVASGSTYPKNIHEGVSAYPAGRTAISPTMRRLQNLGYIG